MSRKIKLITYQMQHKGQRSGKYKTKRDTEDKILFPNPKGDKNAGKEFPRAEMKNVLEL